MKRIFLRFLPLCLSLLAVLSLISCGNNAASDASAVTEDTAHTLQAESGASSAQEILTKDPLTYLIFGSKSYVQGENLIGEVSWEVLPLSFVSPYAVKIKNPTEWERFYSGVPRLRMDENFIDGLNKIDDSFFKKSFIVAVFVYEKSPAYTHEVTSVSPQQNGNLDISITTHETSNASMETAIRCIMIPVSKEFMDLKVNVTMSRENN